MILFISDLHLDPERPAITQAFFEFLDTTAQHAQALYILGDFFEAWLGDDDDTPIYHEVTRRLKHYADQGHGLYFMHGNRDFLVGDLFAQASGATLLPDPSVINYEQQQYLLMHGDSLCTKDDDYMQFRATVRAPQWQQAILAKPLAERRAYAQAVRAQSRSMTSLKAADILDVTPEEVVNIMSHYNIDKLIHGHTHRPKVHSVALNNNVVGTRYVLGDWEDYGWYIALTKESIELKKFAIKAANN